MWTAEILGKAIGLGLSFVLCDWVFHEVLGWQPTTSYVDLFLITAFASMATLWNERRAKRKRGSATE